MIGNVALVVVLTLANTQPLAAPADKSATAAKKDRKGKAERAEAGSAFTGCVDQQEGQYVLVAEKTLRHIATLQAETFEQEGFAKHLGHRVRVRGRVSGAPPLLRVRSVEALSTTCTPPEEKQ